MRATFAMQSVAVLFACACASTSSKAVEAPEQKATLPELEAALTIPPSPGSDDALAQLRPRATHDARAAWVRAHYLLDLFDDARFRGDDDSLGTLAAALDIEPRRGKRATNEVIDGLLVEVDGVLRLSRLHSEASAARRILQADRNPTSPETFGAQSRVLHSVVEGASTVAPNATMRLAAGCESALRDAVKAPRARRWHRARYCFWSLYARDPAPFDGPDRPPVPPMDMLTQDLGQLYERVSNKKGRLNRAASARLAKLRSWLPRNRHELPIAPSLGEAVLVSAAAPFGWTPWFTSAEHARKIRLDLAVAADERTTAAWLGARTATGRDVENAVAVARSAGALRLELLVKTAASDEQRDALGWLGERAPTHRASVLSLALSPRGVTTTGPSASVPRGQRWRPERDSVALAIVLRKDRWQIHALGHRVAEIDAGDTVSLVRVLELMTRAFPDLRSVSIHADEDVLLEQIAQAASTARYRHDGGTRLAQLVWAPPQLDGSKGSSKARRRAIARIERRAAASVQLDPAPLGQRRAIIRRCYQDYLDAKPRARARFELELRGTAVWVTRGPRKGALWACAVPALTELMVGDGIERAVIRLLAPPGPSLGKASTRRHSVDP